MYGGAQTLAQVSTENFAPGVTVRVPPVISIYYTD